jgi:hypothetical protein
MLFCVIEQLESSKANIKPEFFCFSTENGI